MTGRPIHVIQHERHETPGHINDWLAIRGLDHIILQARDGFADINPDDIACLILLGGAVNLDDTARPDWLEEERALLGELARRPCPILGICLGSQLLADALGAEVRLADKAEIGWHDLVPDLAALEQCGLAHLPMPASVMEWHGRTFDLPKGATRLAATAWCTNQAFIANGRHIGLQFHPEWTKEITAAVAKAEPAEPNGQNIQSLSQIMAGDFDQTRSFLWGVLDHLISLVED